jgi:hypothetical protein
MRHSGDRFKEGQRFEAGARFPDEFEDDLATDDYDLTQFQRSLAPI